MAIAAITAAITVGSSLSEQVEDPERYGLRWDVKLSQFTEDTLVEEGANVVADDPRVSALASGTSEEVAVNGRGVNVIAMNPIRGEVRPPLVRGKYPAAADAVALGAQPMEQFDTAVGRSVELDFSEVDGEIATYRVVGEVVMPPAGFGGRLDEGVLLSVLSLIPGRRAAHLRPGPVLRSE